MTRTELDLRECFADRADTAPDAAAVLARLGRPHRRVPVGLMVAVAVVAVVALAVSQLGGAGRTARNQAATGTDPALLDYGLHLDAPPAGYTIASRNLTAATSRVVYDGAGNATGAGGAADVIEVVAYRAGGFDASSVRTGTAVSINGVDGWYGPANGHVDNGAGADGDASAPSVAWQYGPQSWVVVTGTSTGFQTQTVELAVAETVHPGGGYSVRLPFRVGEAPAGLTATRVDTRIDSSPVSASVGFGSPTSVTVDAMYLPGGADAAVAGGERRTVDGHAGAMLTMPDGGHRLVIAWNDWVVGVSGAASVATDDLVAVAQGLTLTASADPGAWFPAADALG